MIFVIVALVYGVNVRNEFVRLDDPDYVTKNASLASGLTKDSVAWSFRLTKYAHNWHPLTWISHGLDVSIADWLELDWRVPEDSSGAVVRTSGPLACLVHGENVLFHAANAVLLYFLLLSISGRAGGNAGPADVLVPTLLALIWALHPLRVEVVAWAAERKELLSVFFMLLSLLAYVNSRYWLSVPCVALALLAKPVAVSLPAVFFAFDFLLVRTSLRRALSRALPFVLLAAAASALTFLSQSAALEQGREWSWLTRIVCAVEAPAVYLAQTFWPVGLSPDYRVPGFQSWTWMVAGALLHLCVLAVPIWNLLRANRWSRLVLFGVAWVYVGLLPMIGVVKVGYEPHSDRYTYWIGCGCAGVLAIAFAWLRPLEVCHRRRVLGGATVLLAALAILTFAQSRHWRDSRSLFARIVGLTHSEYFSSMLGDILVAEGEQGKAAAEAMLRDTLDVRRSPNARAALALHLAAYGRGTMTTGLSGDDETHFPEARILAERALEEPCRADWAVAALAIADYRDKRYVRAYRNLKEAIGFGFEPQSLGIDVAEWKRLSESGTETER